jgi:putative transposase
MKNNPFGYSKTKLNWIVSDVNILYRDNVEDIIADRVLEGLKEMMETALRVEVMEYNRAGRHERTKARQDHSNGYRKRNLLTKFGLLKHLLIPRTRKRGYVPQVFGQYQRRWKVINDWLRDIFVAGVSTRDVGWVMKALVGRSVSASTVSLVCKALDTQIMLFRQRALSDGYRYLFFDGIVQKVRSCGRVVKKVVLVVYGVTSGGRREIIDFRVAGSESEREWTMFLTSLYQRGLKGVGVQMVVTDGGRGLLAALDMIYPYIPRQRCWVHKLRNVANYLPRRLQADCLQDAKGIYRAANYQQAVRRFRRWCQRWRDQAPKAVKCLERDIEQLFTFFDQEKKLWIKLRTTNVIERMFRELRKRTRPMTHFVNVKSCERITFAVINKYNQKWKDRRYVLF